MAETNITFENSFEEHLWLEIFKEKEGATIDARAREADYAVKVYRLRQSEDF